MLINNIHDVYNEFAINLSLSILLTDNFIKNGENSNSSNFNTFIMWNWYHNTHKVSTLHITFILDLPQYHLDRYSNTLSSEGKDGKIHIFRHPFLQTWGLSVGEFACIFLTFAWNAFKNRHNQSSTEEKDTKEPSKFSTFIFLPAAIFHQGSRCLIFMALIFTTASSFQILSGSNLIFACLFAKIFLKRSYKWHKWIGVLIITSM